MPSPVEPEPARKKRASKKAGKRRTAGRFEVLNAFVDVTLRELDATAAVVWLILYRDTKPNGLACTSQSDLARRAGLSISSIYRALRRLTRLGLLTLVRRGRVNSGASVYRVRAEIELGFRER
ncbi:MAG: helix-turn-helix domain-containing protein [Phycisphaerae bacterium]|nr:helix-turn-helix domain-containing protein [Phycisphaerae bacterium]